MRSIALALVLAALPALANERFYAGEAFDALKVKDLPVSPRAPVWAQAHAKTFLCAAQRTVRLNDKAANAELARDLVSTVTLRAAYTDEELAVMVEWKDATKNALDPRETNTYPDGAALEFPVAFGGKQRLPHVAMGDDAAHVYVYLAKAAEASPVVSAFVGSGFGSLTRAPQLKVKAALEYDVARELWRAVFVRPLKDGDQSLDVGLVPVAVAMWNGALGERGGNKYLSSWKFIRLGRHPVDEQFLATASWGYGFGDLGDPIKGKQLFEVACMACHWTEQRRTAPVGLAPDLSAIGVYQTASYIRDSIVNPTNVVVHHLQLNRHVDVNAPPDPNGARPNSTAFAWFNTLPDGAKFSRMPPFSGLKAEDIADVVAYLKTLDGTIR